MKGARKKAPLLWPAVVFNSYVTQAISMAKMFIPVIWGGTLLNMVSTFYGFQTLLGSQSLRADLFAAVATLAATCCAIASAYVWFHRRGLSGFVWKAIWMIFISFGLFAALFGNFALFPAPIVSSNLWTIFDSEMRTFSGETVFWFTLVFLLLSMMHSELPDGYGGPEILRMFRAQRP